MVVYVMGALLIGLDQWTKQMALHALRGSRPISLVGHILQLEYVENRGAAFGMLQNQRWIFIVMTLAIIGGLIYYMYRSPMSLSKRLALVTILAGAVGNLINRIVDGYVIDFIRVDLVDFYNFPVFNVADICVCIGCVLLLLVLLKEEGKKRENHDRSTEQ